MQVLICLPRLDHQRDVADHYPGLAWHTPQCRLSDWSTASRQAIEKRSFPFPTGLRIDTVETGPGEGLVVMSVPPQPEELKPFLVHRAIVGGKIQGAYISIVRRSGEDSIPITAQQIHSTLAAGRALLPRGQFPDAPPPEQAK